MPSQVWQVAEQGFQIGYSRRTKELKRNLQARGEQSTSRCECGRCAVLEREAFERTGHPGVTV